MYSTQPRNAPTPRWCYPVLSQSFALILPWRYQTAAVLPARPSRKLPLRGSFGCVRACVVLGFRGSPWLCQRPGSLPGPCLLRELPPCSCSGGCLASLRPQQQQQQQQQQQVTDCRLRRGNPFSIS